jgi:Arc/MetJ family transcription regulator
VTLSNLQTDSIAVSIYTLYVYWIARMKHSTRRSSDRTNIVLDTALVNRVKRLAKVRTTRDAVHLALDHYVRSRDYSAVLALRGSGGVAEGYDPKAVSPQRN